MKHSDYYITDEDRLFKEEYGTPYDDDISLDPKQKLRREALEKQANQARKKYGITFENAFKAETIKFVLDHHAEYFPGV